MRALLISETRYPEDRAETYRQQSFAKLLQALGWEVLMISRGETTSFKEEAHDGVNYISMRGSGTNILSKIFDYLLFTKRLKKLISERPPFDLFFLFGSPTTTAKYLVKTAKKENKKLVYDAVEWYSPEEFKHPAVDIQYRKKQYWITKLTLKHFKVVSISKFLEAHYSSNGVKTVRIPPLFDIAKTPCEKEPPEDCLRLMYAGAFGAKDYLTEAIEGLSLLTEDEKKRVRFDLLGPKPEQLSGLREMKPEALKKAEPCIYAHGRVLRTEVFEYLRKADFTVLLRPEQLRYAKAGFPTKVVESLSAATPMMCNITSDLGDYLRDGENSVIVDACTPEAFAAAVRKALLLSAEQKTEMRSKARKTAESSFDYGMYTKTLNELLGE